MWGDTLGGGVRGNGASHVDGRGESPCGETEAIGDGGCVKLHTNSTTSVMALFPDIITMVVGDMVASMWLDANGDDLRACMRSCTTSATVWPLLPSVATTIAGGVLGRIFWAGVDAVGEMCRGLG